MATTTTIKNKIQQALVQKLETAGKEGAEWWLALPNSVRVAKIANYIVNNKKVSDWLPTDDIYDIINSLNHTASNKTSFLGDSLTIKW